MAVKGLEGLNGDQINLELQRGAKFVVFEYCISIIIMTFKRSSDIHFIRSGEGTVGKSLPYSLLTLVVGWWGIPWGPIYTIGSVATNFGGGRDVTAEFLDAMRQGE